MAHTIFAAAHPPQILVTIAPLRRNFRVNEPSSSKQCSCKAIGSAPLWDDIAQVRSGIQNDLQPRHHQSLRSQCRESLRHRYQLMHRPIPWRLSRATSLQPTCLFQSHRTKQQVYPTVPAECLYLEKVIQVEAVVVNLVSMPEATALCAENCDRLTQQSHSSTEFALAWRFVVGLSTCPHWKAYEMDMAS